MSSRLAATVLVLILSLGALTGEAQELDYTLLAQPGYSNRLGLTDEQRRSVTVILDERLTALASAKPEDRPKVLSESNARLAALLSEEQKQTFASLLAGGKIQFNFRQQTWPEVLDWFAKQSELSLVMETVPDGQFTYSDTKEYEPKDAVDLLNSVLLGKGFTLMRRDKMLLVVDISGGIPFELAPKVTVEELASRGRFEIVTAEFDLGGRPIDACLSAIKELVGEQGRVTPLTTAGKILVTETAGKLEAVNIVISSVPVPKPPAKPQPAPKPPPPVFTVYPAPGLDPVTTVETLQGLFSAATIKADPNAEELHVYAPPALQDGIKASLDKMLANIGGVHQMRLESYHVEDGSLEPISEQLKTALPKIEVTIDETQRRLLVLGNEQQQQAVNAFLEELGATAAGDPGTRQVKMYPVDADQTEAVTELLTQVIPRALVVTGAGRVVVRGTDAEQKLAEETINQFLQPGPAENPMALRFYATPATLPDGYLELLQQLHPKAVFSPLPSGKLSVLAREDDHQELKATLEQINEETTSSASKTAKVYPVTPQQKARVTEVLAEVGGELNEVKLLADSRPRAITVWANAPQHEQFEALLQSLSDGDEPRTLQRHAITVADPSELISLLADRFPDVDVVLDAPQQELLSWLTDGQLDEFKLELERLQSELPRREDRQLTPYSLHHLTATEAETLLQRLAPNATITADEAGRRLIIWATPAEHEQIADAISKLDQNVPNRERNLETYDLSTTAADSVLSAVQAVVPAAEVRLDGAGETLIAIGSAEDQSRIADLVAKLVPEENNARVLIGYSLEESDPTAVVAMLQELQPQLSFAADTRSRRVLVTAPLREQARIQAVIEQLDTAPATEKVCVESYRLETLDATVVNELLQPLFPEMQISADESSGQIVATGSEIDQQKLAAAIARIEQTGTEQGEVQSYFVGSADTDQVRSVLLQLVPSAVVSANSQAGQVMVWANAEQQQAISAAIEQFTETRPDQARVLRVHSLEFELRDQQLSFLRTIVPQAEITTDVAAGQLICWAVEADQEALLQALSTLQEQADQREDQLLKVHESDPAVLRNARPMVEELAPGARIIDGPDENRWLVWATPGEHQELEQLLVTLQTQLSDDASQRKLKAYPLDKVDESVLRELITSVAEGVTLLDSSDPTRLLLFASEKEHEAVQKQVEELQRLDATPESMVEVYTIKRPDLEVETVRDTLSQELSTAASVQVNTSTNSLIVRAKPKEHATIRAAFETLIAELPATPTRSTEVYQVRHSDPESVATVLSNLVPSASLAVDPETGALAVTASPTDQERIRAVVDQMQEQGSGASLTTEIYRFRHVSAETAHSTFTLLAPQARLGYDTSSGVVVATASESDQAILKAAAEKLDGFTPSTTVKVYAIDRQKMTAADVAASLDSALKEQISLQVNPSVNSLIVRGDEASQAAVQAAIDAIIEQFPTPEKLEPEVYRLKRASPVVVAESLQPLVPTANIVGDEATGSILVTANEADHAIVKSAIDNLDQLPDSTPVVQAHPIRQGDPRAVYESLELAFRDNPDFAMTFQTRSRAILLVASPDNQQVFAELVAAMDLPKGAPAARVARVYNLENVAGEAAASALNNLYQGVLPPVRIDHDQAGNTLLVVAAEQQQQSIKAAIEEMEGKQRLLEVFDLQINDALTIEDAINDLFYDVPEGTAPTVSGDYSTQKLFVRGTESQIEQIREMLARMGETTVGQTTRQSGEIRSIPFRGDTRRAAAQLEKIWPRLRSNRIQVIIPSERDLQPRRPGQLPKSNDSSSRFDAGSGFRFVAFQDSVRKPAPSEESQSDDSEQPAVVIIPEDGRITIASSDEEALDQLEQLLRAMARGGEGSGPAINFSVFLLRNSGATDMQRLLKELFEQMPFGRSSTGDVVVVADDRMNALVVYGSQKDRDLVEELLQVLDGEDVPTPLGVKTPVLIQVHNTQAERILGILENVYKTQLTSGGGRRQVQIPKGVSSDVASVLQQINAASAGPLLLLDVDESSNSIVMRAPPELSTEIEKFVKQLDQEGSTASTRGVRVIRLRRSSAERLEPLIRQLLVDPE